MIKYISIQDRMQSAGSVMTGFDYLRIILSIAVLVWHSLWVSSGSTAIDNALWSGPYRFIPAAILPMFFALSGFLVTGSLRRTRLHQFITLRLVRLVPALAAEVILSALLLGTIFTVLPLPQYLTNDRFYAYFLNIIGWIHYELPGVFENNPSNSMINAQLWTIPYELECYIALISLSTLKIVRKRIIFAALVVVLTAVFTTWVYMGNPVPTNIHVPGRVLLLSFLVAVTIYLYRDKMPYSHSLGMISAILSLILLQISNTSYLAAFPIAYMTVWIGLMRPPAIPFGDLSYGVFLFHYPVEQTIVHISPSIRSWWLLTLIALPLTGVCAWLSWNLIEKPILIRKKNILEFVDHFWAKLPDFKHLVARRRTSRRLIDRV